MEQHILEDYVKQIHALTERGGRASSTALAAALGVAAPAVSKALPRLAAMGLIQHDPYRGAELTDTGRLMAVEVIRHHRLVEMFLHQALGMSWDEVHAEAERLEHVVSEAMEARMDAFLGYPAVDPHGHPIPTADLYLATCQLPRLSDSQPGDEVILRRVDDRDDAVLRHLERAGMVPGAGLRVVEVSPMEGVVRLSVGGEDRTLALKIADQVYVEAAAEATGAARDGEGTHAG
jgi:DtxR family Mn-dependent transcriptional regulator